MNLSRSSNAHEAHLLVSALCAFFSYRIRSTSLRVDLAAATTVVELGGARIGVPGHVLGHLDRAAVFKEGGDAGARQLWLQICVVIPAFFARRWSMSQASDWLIRCSVRVPIVLRRWPPSVPESAGNMISVAVVLIAGDEYR